MLYVRTVKTASGSTAVQVIRYHQRKRMVLRHIGSAHTPEELSTLNALAHAWIDQEAQQLHLFPAEKKTHQTLIPLNKLQNLGFRYTFAQEVITRLFDVFHFSSAGHQILLDLVLMRMLQPASKRESFRLLAEYFGIAHTRADFYRSVSAMLVCEKKMKEKAIHIAQQHFAFDFRMVFYDVTTLYFESFAADEDTTDEHGVTTTGLRKPGFSKDHKNAQPQIVIGLMVTKEGFPVSYEIFSGNTFEGDTFIPSICRFKDTYDVKKLTVVADAGMISFAHVESLIAHNLSYIVGARVAGLKLSEIKKINMALNQVDGSSMRIDTARGMLICDFSVKRYHKDKREMEKQITKAEKLVAKNTEGKRAKFLGVKNKKETAYEVNTALVEKTKLLLGIKGYYTNVIQEENATIIAQYHSLWHVELAFRIAKNDLEMRPIYHVKKETIEAHILICFMALAVCKYMELKTGRSTKALIHLLKQVTDARILNMLTNEEIIIRSEISAETQQVVNKLFLSH